jgi:hypothetical protein
VTGRSQTPRRRRCSVADAPALHGRNAAPVVFECFARLVLAAKSERAAPREPTLARGFFVVGLKEQRGASRRSYALRKKLAKQAIAASPASISESCSRFLAALEALKGDQRSEPNFMPDRIGDQMAGVRPEATRVFGRNAQIPVIPR